MSISVLYAVGNVVIKHNCITLLYMGQIWNSYHINDFEKSLFFQCVSQGMFIFYGLNMRQISIHATLINTMANAAIAHLNHAAPSFTMCLEGKVTCEIYDNTSRGEAPHY